MSKPSSPPEQSSPTSSVRRASAWLNDRLQPAGSGPGRPFGPAGDSQVDRVAPFSGVVMAMRLATTAIGLLLASQDLFNGSAPMITATIAVVLYATLRGFRPVRYTDNLEGLLAILGEVSLHVGAVLITGGWDSPFVFSLITAVSLSGFAQGYIFALQVGAVSAAAVSLPAFLAPNASLATVRATATWSGMLMLISVVSGYGRRISGDADRERDLALDRLSRMSDANALLYSLHRVAQTLPQSLDMNEVMDSTVTRLRALIDFEALAIVLYDDTDDHWRVMRTAGCTTTDRFTAHELASGLRLAAEQARVVSIDHITPPQTGLLPGAQSGLYAPLTARGATIGLIALEHHLPNHFDHRDGGLLGGFVPALSLAMDNARWFERLRTVGADEERTRIARDLHDRIGQSLAYIAFELDRMVGKDRSGEPVTDNLEQLREDVRGVIREVRDTLYDLRTDVTDDKGLVDILEQFAGRVSERSGLTIDVTARSTARLPILQEREMWRIAQEAVTNVERHAHATHVSISWECNGSRAVIQVTDNGVGFEAGRAGRLDSYGMMGMRERASSIGARLDIVSAPGDGTTVTCVLDTSQPPQQDAESAPLRAATPGGFVSPEASTDRALSSTGGHR